MGLPWAGKMQGLSKCLLTCEDIPPSSLPLKLGCSLPWGSPPPPSRGQLSLCPSVAGAGMEGAGQQDLHVHGTPWLAHGLAAGWEVQEDTQKHHDQPDGHSGGGHQETGERGPIPGLWEQVATIPGGGDSQGDNCNQEDPGPHRRLCPPSKPYSFGRDQSEPHPPGGHTGLRETRWLSAVPQ